MMYYMIVYICTSQFWEWPFLQVLCLDSHYLHRVRRGQEELCRVEPKLPCHQVKKLWQCSGRLAGLSGEFAHTGWK